MISIIQNKKPSLFIVGSFPKNAVFGGIQQSCKLILESTFFSDRNIIQFDSSHISNPPPPFFIRFILAGIRLFRFIFKLIINQPLAILIFCSDGASALEKGVMVRLSKLAGIKVLIFPRAGNLISQVMNFKTFRGMIKYLFNKADIFLAQGNSWKTFAHLNLDISSSKIRLIHNWTATKKLLDIGRERDYTRTENIIRFLFVGWLEREKGVFEILNSIKDLDTSNFSFSFTFVGDGKAMKKAKDFVVKNQLNEKVFFEGWVLNEKLAEYYKNADIFILPSWAEGMPNSLIEALSCGLATIVSNVGLIPNYLTNNENSLIIPPRDSVNLSRAMKKVILDKNLKIKISQNGYEIAVNYFSTEKGLEKLSKIIKKTISDE